MKNKLIVSLFVLVLSGFTIQAFAVKPSCINLYVDYGSLTKQNKLNECIEQDNINALDFIKQSGYKTEGTVKYGDAVLCIKKKQVLLFPRNEWGWAEKAINETTLYAGDSIGLVFSTNGELRWP